MAAVSMVILAAKIDELEKIVDRHDELLVRGEGPNQPPIPERIREMEKVFKEIGFWVRSIGLLFLGQFIVVLFTMLYGFATKNGNEYIILQAGKRNKLYNIVKKGDPMPTGGYYELKSIMRLKGINGFQSGGAR